MTNVCLKALTIPASQLPNDPGASTDPAGPIDQSSTDPISGSPAVGSGLAATGDGMSFVVAALTLLSAMAALVLIAKRRKHTRSSSAMQETR